jgi:hypothetical protein
VNPRTRSRKTRLPWLIALTTAIVLAGCSPATSPSTPMATPNLSGNWQIQSGSSVTTPIPAGYLQGALQTQGSQVTGTLFTGSVCNLPEVLSYTGSVDSMGNLTLTSPGVSVQLLVPTNPETVATGTLNAGALPGGRAVCNTIEGLTPAVGVQIAPLTGTFSGPITASSSSATVSVALTQSTTPNTQGQFPLTGTLTFTGACASVIPISGTVAGTAVVLQETLSPTSPPPSLNVGILANTNPAASQIVPSAITFSPTPCSTAGGTTTYTGTLTRQ